MKACEYLPTQLPFMPIIILLDYETTLVIQIFLDRGEIERLVEVSVFRSRATIAAPTKRPLHTSIGSS